MVDVVESCIVVPSEETPKHRIWLSNLDLVAPKGYTPKVYLYRKNTTETDYFSVKVLKDAFAKALVHFYPFAGRLAEDSNGRLEIDCNGKGALFVVARSEFSTEDFQEFKPSAEVKQLFFPNMDVVDPPCILLMVQVTFLRCGSVVMGVTDHHMVGDGHNINYFVETWCSIARGITNPPISRSYDRTLLRACSSLFSEQTHRPAFSPYDHPDEAPPPAITCIWNITKDQLHLLKSRCPTGTTYTTIASHLWRSMCLARKLSVDQETRLLFPVDVRNRVVPPLPSEYFGGAIVSLIASAKAADLVSMPLGFGAEKIRQAIEKVDDGYVRSFINHIESEETRRKMGMRETIRNTDLVVISWLGLGSYNADFGWGSPDWMSFAQLPACGFVCLNDSPKKDGGVSVVLALEHETVDRFKKIFYEEINIPTVEGPRPFQLIAKSTLLTEISGFNSTKIESHNTDVLLNI
ncbi:hypothetical protein LUZ60_002907 [Juncus effusus]|nr:hypothetical protein LUZ60_002907 [Juncus effusus]